MAKIQRENNRSGRATGLSSLLFLAFFLLLSNSVGAQKADYVFQSGEKITYGAYYNWGILWVNAGEVTFEADMLHRKGETQWQFLAEGRTYKAYDLFYTVRDTFVSYAGVQGLQADYFNRRVNHGKSSTLHEYAFDAESKKIYSRIKREKEALFHDTLSWKPATADMLTTVYQFRNYDFDALKKGDKVNFRMLVDNKTEDLYFRYLGQEVVKTREGRKFRCHHVSIALLGGDFFPDGEHMNVWFTADRNHIPVKVETEILVGSVSAILTGLEQIKYPLTSEID